MLELFKQEKSFLTRAKEKNSLKYLIRFDDNGAYIEVCDNKLKLIKDIDYRVYNGLDREILQYLELSYEDEFFNVNWESDTANLYLYKHPRLFELLRQNGKFFVTSGNEITFSDEISTLELEIMEASPQYETTLRVNSQSAFRFITPNYVLLKDKVVQVHNIGENFNKLMDFNTNIQDCLSF